MTLERQQEREYMVAELRLAKAAIRHNDLLKEKKHAETICVNGQSVSGPLDRLYDLAVHELIEARNEYLEMSKVRNGWTK